MKNTKQGVKRVVIAGGGTAGWMAAVVLSKVMGRQLDVTLVESEEIGTVGVGEATIPTLYIFHQLVGINEQEFMTATNATFKLSIAFEHWLNQNEEYLHSFGLVGKETWMASFHHYWLKGLQKGIKAPLGDYCHEHLAARLNKFADYEGLDLARAYHLDAGLYAQYLRKISEAHGTQRIEGKIDQVNVDAKSGMIKSLALESGQVVEGDLFIDCTGFKGLLIEEALHTGYEDWSHWLPCDRAVTVQTTSQGPTRPYTRSIAHEAGWRWQIPLQNRTGNGLVYCSRYMSDEQAKALLLDSVDGDCITEPQTIPFRTGTRRKYWNKNCIAMGLSSGFVEPLESTSIHLIQRSIIKLILLLPSEQINESDIDEYNSQMREEMDNIRDFVTLHYHATERDDSRFWQHCRSMSIPSSLQHRIDLFRDNGRVFKKTNEIFSEIGWVQVMLGQGIVPKAYHPAVDNLSDKELSDFLHEIRSVVKHNVEQLPSHDDFLAQYVAKS